MSHHAVYHLVCKCYSFFFSSSVLAILCPWKITQIVQIDRVINTRKQREKSQLKLLRLPKSIEGETTTWQK